MELDELLRQAIPDVPVSAVRAEIANTPANVSDDLYVTVPAFDGDPVSVRISITVP